MDTKICNGCKLDLPLDSYYKHPMGKLGVQPRCIKCQKREQQARLADPQAKERHAARVRNGHLRRRYKIDDARYEEMLASQGGGCALCGKTKEENGRRLAVDHCHRTGNVRGILCNPCNKLLHSLENDGDWIQRAAAYLNPFMK